MTNLIKFLALSAVIATGAVSAAGITGGGVTGGGVTGVSGVSGGLGSDFASSTSPAGNSEAKGGLANALDEAFGDNDKNADAECAKLGRCEN